MKHSIPGRLELIVDTSFPNHPEITWVNLEPSSVFQEITSDELTSIAAKILKGKVPGSDGIPNMIVKAVLIRKSGILLGLFNTCLKKGIFPSKWKQAKLVLIKKGGKSFDQPSSYRPIYLLDIVGKLF